VKILYVLSFLPPYITREIQAVAELGHDVTVMLPEKNNNSETADFWNGISTGVERSSCRMRHVLKFMFLTCASRKLFKPFLYSLKHFCILIKSLKESEFRYFLIAEAAVREIPADEKPDVIHSHFAHDQAHIARFMAAIMKVPFTVTTHATDIFVPESRTRLCRVLESASRAFTISEYNRNYLKESRFKSKKLVVVRVGLNTAELPERRIPAEPLAVCTASGLVSKKGVDVLIRAMRILHSRNIICPLTVIGSDPGGNKLQEFRKQVPDLPIEFVGALPSRKTLEIMAGATFFVLPCIEAVNGDRDGIPVALMEAMGMGVPCISTEISGIPELIENSISGLLVKPGSPEELADSMAVLLFNRETADRLGSAGREKVITCYNSGKLAELLAANLMEVAAEGVN
jgi:colanic acid/amylovoran biosynthesis glycosyltransferase